METRIVKTELDKIEISTKQDTVPEFDKTAIAVTGIESYPDHTHLKPEEITQDAITCLLKQLANGDDLFFYLDEYQELEFLDAICDGEWISLLYSNKDISYSCYNTDFEGVEEDCPLEYGGQSPIRKFYALTDIQLGLEAVEYFIHTGKLYPKIEWAKLLDE